jgi:hypothetical protein
MKMLQDLVFFNRKKMLEIIFCITWSDAGASEILNIDGQTS